MKKQNTYRSKKNISAGGLRGIAQSFVSVGIPTVIESSVREEYSYFKKQGQKSILYTLTDEVKVRV
ncbi:MAG: hypothetical protein IKS41_01455 [Alphaproteobacteria bacterium]|nr:hypothetical protein [Alphaproteobacteria bacterium]